MNSQSLFGGILKNTLLTSTFLLNILEATFIIGTHSFELNSINSPEVTRTQGNKKLRKKM